MPKSKTQTFFEKRAATPQATVNMYKNVSQYRREALADEINDGRFVEGSGDKQLQSENGITVSGNVTYGGKLTAEAQAALNQSGSGLYGNAAGAGGYSYRGNSNSAHQTPEVYSPLWLNSNLNLPRDKATINAWCRTFFALNPIVHNSITLHSTYPIAKMNIKCKDRKVEKFFSQMADEIDLINVCVNIAQEFYVLGEAFPLAEFDERTGKWSRITLQNPDYIHVVRSVVAGEPILSLRPDENLRRLVFSNKPADILQKKQLDPAIVEHIRRGENIPLNNMYVSHIARRIAPYEVRGSGLLVSCFKSLMMFDKIMESKFVQADQMINPMTLVKIGGPEHKPTPADLDQWRNIFEQAQYNKDFKLFTHNEVTVERVGYSGGVLDVNADLDRIIKNIYIGLMVPAVIMDGSDTTYATGSVALDVLRQRYMQFRNMLSAWLRRKIFAPISKINDFYEYVDGEKVLIVPDIDWNHMSLFDMSDYIQNLATLTTGEGPAKRLSLQTLYRSLGVDYEDEVRKIKYEDIQDMIRKKELVSLERHSLNELRALTPEDEIDEVQDAPLPGEASPYDAAGSAAPGGGGGMPGADMGGMGLPPMPGAPPAAIGGTGIGPGDTPKPPGPA